jgi:hypothetical protein
MLARRTRATHAPNALFIEIVASMTSQAGDLVLAETPDPDDRAELAGYLRAYAGKQLKAVLTPDCCSCAGWRSARSAAFQISRKYCTRVVPSAHWRTWRRCSSAWRLAAC